MSALIAWKKSEIRRCSELPLKMGIESSRAYGWRIPQPQGLKLQ